MIRIAVLGCGRIGAMHAANIAAHPRARLAACRTSTSPRPSGPRPSTGATCDATRRARFCVARRGRRSYRDGDRHARRSAGAGGRGGKAGALREADRPEPGRGSTAARGNSRGRDVQSNSASSVVSIPATKPSTTRFGLARSAICTRWSITSRDPGLAPEAYLKVSGRIFRDMTIHDFDMARYILGEEPERRSPQPLRDSWRPR